MGISIAGPAPDGTTSERRGGTDTHSCEQREERGERDDDLSRRVVPRLGSQRNPLERDGRFVSRGRQKNHHDEPGDDAPRADGGESRE
jgi:hypothetical protein